MEAGTHTRLLAVLAVTGSALAWAAPPRYVASRDIIVEYAAANGAPVSKVELWVSADAGRAWQIAEAAATGQHALCYTAPADGKYEFYIVLNNAAGPSTESPTPGSAPTITTVVDTVAPLLQIHATDVQWTEGGPTVTLKASLIEENLSPAGLRVFYRTDGQKWIDGGPAAWADRRIVWTPPSLAGPRVELRVVVTDLAGNRSVADVPGLTIPPSPLAPEHEAATTQPAVAPVALASDEQPADTDITPAPGLPADVQHLRNLADRFMGEGRYSLAAARFEDAVSAAPHDADLLTQLGTALYRSGRQDDAGTRFREALAAKADHAGALEGLALVAVTQKQYAQAREYLRHLQRLEPNSGRVWLRSGDVEHRLGNMAQALEAWRRVLTSGETDKDLREKAQRRLEYFGPQRLDNGKPPATNDTWPELQQPRPSSSSAATSRTRKPSP